MNQRIKNIDLGLVNQLWEEYALACNSGDFEHWISLWDDDAIQMPPDTPRRVGKVAIRKKMKSLFDDYAIIDMSIQTEEVRILGGRAYAHGIYNFQLKPKGGGEIKSYSGKFLDILKKGPDGCWKIAIDCFNYDEPRNRMNAGAAERSSN